jgi:hypothetical protein
MTSVNIEAIRPLAMEHPAFWKLMDHAADGSGLSSLKEAVNKLNWKQLLAYDIRMRLVLLEGLSKILDGASPTETDIRTWTPRLVPILLQGRMAWSQLSRAQVDDVELLKEPIDLDAFFTHVERAYIHNFFMGTGILRTNPTAVTNGILNFKLLTRSDPWQELSH